MMMSVRAWWWARGRSNPEEMPRDVREYIVRRHLKAAVEGAKTLEEKHELSTSLMSSALSLDNDQRGGDLRDELIAASSKLLDGVPVRVLLDMRCGCGDQHRPRRGWLAR